MNYEEALRWVHSLVRVTPAPELKTIKQLLAALGNPQRRLCFVHIAGTNGKGSTAVMVAQIMRVAGYKTGLNISPYVHSFCERIQVNGQPISKEELAHVLMQVRDVAEQLQLPLKEFEAVTAAAFVYFESRGCNIVCMEAGIGGLNDPTNIIQNTLVACLTRIGYDHTELLGNTLAKITREKCGIIKNGCTVVSFPAQPARAAYIIEQEAKHKGSPLVVPKESQAVLRSAHIGGSHFIYKGIEVNLPLAGVHQIQNSLVALECIFALRHRGFAIKNHDIEKGLLQVRFPARIEVLRTHPPLLLDGAHNEDSAMALAGLLKKYGLHNLLCIMGVLRDKQAHTIIKLLAPYIKMLCAVAPPHPRALAAAQLAALAQPYINNIEICGNLTNAAQKALASQNGALVCGSFYLASALRPHLLTHYNKREPRHESQ